MGLLDRLRAWLGGSRSDGSDRTDSDSEEDGSGDDGSPRLDPENVTEVRSESDDDPVERLRELEDDPPESDDEP